jgi:hypothetical protein
MNNIILYIFCIILSSIPNTLAIQAYDKNKDYKNEHTKSYNYLKMHMFLSLFLLIILIAALFLNKK